MPPSGPYLRRRLSALLLTLLLSGSAATVCAQETDEPVSLNFANADIDSVVLAIGKITGKNFLVDPRVKGTLNIITNTPVSRELSYEILLSALRLQGYTAVEGPAGVVKIIPESDAKQHGVPVTDGSNLRGESLVTEVFPMRHESANQMLSVVRPLVTPNNTVTAFPSNNALIVTDYASNMAKIRQIIASVDVPQSDVTVIPLQYAVASDMANTIMNLLNNENRSGGGNGNGMSNMYNEPIKQVRIIAEPRTNSLLVQSDNPARIRSVRQLAASLDIPGAGGNIHVIYLRNARAEAVAETLNGILSGNNPGSLQNLMGADTSGNNTSLSGTSSGISNQDGRTISGISSDTGTGNNRNNNLNSIVQADNNNNALIIVAPDSIYRNLRSVIEQLDRRRAQVYIEALIAEISLDQAAQIGVQWQVGGMLGNGKGGLVGTNFNSSTGNLVTAMANPSAIGQGLNVVVGRGQVEIPLPDGTTQTVYNLGLLASFFEKDGRGNVLSTPNITTLDNEPAKIMVGSKVPFPTGQYTNTGSTTNSVNPFQTIDREDVGLILEVRPQISEGGMIQLDLYQETSSIVPGTANDTLGPTTRQRTIKSSLLVDDKSILAIGGLVEDVSSNDEQKVPVLGDLPLVGNLFRYRSHTRSKTNLVVFLRPIILRDGESYEQIANERYNHVLGEQMKTGGSMNFRGETTPPLLPPFPQPGSAEPLVQRDHPSAQVTPIPSPEPQSAPLQPAPAQSAPVSRTQPPAPMVRRESWTAEEAATLFTDKEQDALLPREDAPAPVTEASIVTLERTAMAQ